MIAVMHSGACNSLCLSFLLFQHICEDILGFGSCATSISWWRPSDVVESCCWSSPWVYIHEIGEFVLMFYQRLSSVLYQSCRNSFTNSVWQCEQPRWQCGVCWCPVGLWHTGPGTQRAEHGARQRRRRWPSCRPGVGAAAASAAGSLGSDHLCVSLELLAATSHRWWTASPAAAPESPTPPTDRDPEVE